MPKTAEETFTAYETLFPEHTPEFKEYLIENSNLIRETIKYGSDLFLDCVQSREMNFECIIPSLMFLHGLSMLDSVAINIKEGAIEPCKSTLRSLLETIFGLRFMLKSNTEKKAKMFLLCEEHKEIEIWWKETDPNSDEGKAFIERTKNDDQLSHHRLKQIPQLQQYLKQFEAKHNNPLFKPLEDEYQATFQKMNKKNKFPRRKKLPQWYEFFGIQSVGQLAKEVGCTTLYDMVYSNYSGMIHGSDIIKERINFKEKDGGFDPVRIPKNIDVTVKTTLNLVNLLFECFIKHYLPHRKDEYNMWHMQVIVPNRPNKVPIVSKLT